MVCSVVIADGDIDVQCKDTEIDQFVNKKQMSFPFQTTSSSSIVSYLEFLNPSATHNIRQQQHDEKTLFFFFNLFIYYGIQLNINHRDIQHQIKVARMIITSS